MSDYKSRPKTRGSATSRRGRPAVRRNVVVDDEEADAEGSDDEPNGNQAQETTISEDEKLMGESGEPFTDADMRIAARYVASQPNWAKMTSKARWEGFIARVRAKLMRDYFSLTLFFSCCSTLDDLTNPGASTTDGWIKVRTHIVLCRLPCNSCSFQRSTSSPNRTRSDKAMERRRQRKRHQSSHPPPHPRIGSRSLECQKCLNARHPPVRSLPSWPPQNPPTVRQPLVQRPSVWERVPRRSPPSSPSRRKGSLLTTLPPLNANSIQTMTKVIKHHRRKWREWT